MLKKLSLISIFLMLIPVISYAFFVVYFSVDVPYWDDYRSVLQYINTTDDSLRYYRLFDQHNEHRIVWNRLMTEICYLFFGKINFEYLIYIGNFGLIFFFILLLIIHHKKQKSSIVFFIPVSYFIFQPQASENMTWATASLQNNYIIFFALLTLYFWNKETIYGYIAAWFFGVIAIYTSANGLLIFLVLFVFQLINFIEKLYITPPLPPHSNNKKLIVIRQSLLLCISLVLIFLNFYFYFRSYQKPDHHPSIITALLQPLILFKYTATLLGAWMGKTYAFWVGLLEIFIFLLITYKRYYQKNPVVYYFIFFIFLSIFVTALGRSGFGVEQALASRYKTLSIVLLALFYLAFLEIYPKQFSKKLVICFLIFSIVFNIVSVKIYLQALSSMRDTLIEGITTWKHTGQGLACWDQKFASPILNQSIEKGTYYPPNW